MDLDSVDVKMLLPELTMSFYCHFILPLAVFLPLAFYAFLQNRSQGRERIGSVDVTSFSRDIKYSGTEKGLHEKDPQEKTPLHLASPRSRPSKPTQWYRNMYHKLHTLESNPSVLEAARDELLSLFTRTLSRSLDRPSESILRIDDYSAEKLDAFIEDEHSRAMANWRGYLSRRAQGGPPELFATLPEARAWLKREAPVKFVDGAWLAHMHKVTTPFALRGVTKDVWQVLSEELGDGDLAKHHVHLYKQLLNDVGVTLPEGFSADFVRPALWEGVDNHAEWEAGVAQLLISLFPDEFLPEILGFNMHYELITLDTMRAAHELRALGVDPYYFLVHISIDNADSGHTAMALHTVTRYLDGVRESEGEEALEKAWRRVQVGYNMSQTVGSVSTEREPADPAAPPLKSVLAMSPDPLSARVIEIFKAKASVSHEFHCQSRARIGRQSLADYLSPETWAHSQPWRHRELLSELGQAKPWVYPGDSGRSRLVKELSWEGCMFGAFTNDEFAALAAWIDALGPDNEAWAYWSFTRREAVASVVKVNELRDPAKYHPFIPSDETTDNGSLQLLPQRHISNADFELRMTGKRLATPAKARLPDLVALWFAHIGLLENTINTPSGTASPLYASIIRLLRAQAGFASEQHIVAGMDEMKRFSCPSLVDIGLDLISRAGWADTEKPAGLQDVFALTRSKGQGQESARLAEDMLLWAARPDANLGLLLGLALAFLELKDAVARTAGLLGEDSLAVLEAIVGRERQSLIECAGELIRVDRPQHKKMVQGYHSARAALEKCLS